MIKNKEKYVCLLLPILIGLLFFLLLIRKEVLSPTYTAWLFEGDPTQHWLGWEFFRNTPIFQWPIGANFAYGMDTLGSSIVYSDSLPLFAFIFKPFNSLLPVPFQYIGIWLLVCFLLQAHFSWKLLSIFTKDKWLPVIGSVFFIISPIFLQRILGTTLIEHMNWLHDALVGQWILLAGFYLYFTNNFSVFRWTVLLVISSLVHACFLAEFASLKWLLLHF